MLFIFYEKNWGDIIMKDVIEVVEYDKTILNNYFENIIICSQRVVEYDRKYIE